MNYWKAIALSLVTGVVLSAGTEESYAAGECHNQPNMAAALAALRSAKGSLERAEHDKGGWRAAALVSTNTAIKETERGCAFANDH